MAYRNEKQREKLGGPLEESGNSTESDYYLTANLLFPDLENNVKFMSLSIDSSHFDMNIISETQVSLTLR